MARREVTAEIARQLTEYDPESGDLRWRERGPEWFRREKDQKAWNSKHAGELVGCVGVFGGGHKARTASLLGGQYYVHRLIWLIVTGEWPHGEIDHEDQNSLNNRWNNLRDTSHQENLSNCLISKNNSTGVTGVIWRPAQESWVAQIRHQGRCIYLGTHKTLIDAVAARKRAERELGFHLNHGSQNRKGRHI